MAAFADARWHATPHRHSDPRGAKIDRISLARAGGDIFLDELAAAGDPLGDEGPGAEGGFGIERGVRAQRLAPLRQEVARFARSLQDSVLEAESMSWWATTALYTMLQGAARSDASLRTALAPAKD